MKKTVILLLLLIVTSTGFADKPVDPVFFRDNTWKLHSSTGEPLVLIHGLGSDGQQSWSGLLPALKKKYKVLTVGLPGLGGTRPPQTVSPLHYAVYSDWLIRRYFQNRKVTVVCHSYGGAVGLRMLGLFPDKIKRMVIINGAGALHPVAHLLWFAERYTGLQAGSDAPAAQLLFHSSGSLLGTALQSLQFNSLLRKLLPRGGSRLQALLSLQGYDLRHLIKMNNPPPLTFILGRNDHLVPPRSGVYLHYLIRSSRIIRSPQTGHAPIRTDPAGFLPVLRKALNGAGTTAPLLPSSKPAAGRLTWNKQQNRRTVSGNYRTVKLTGCRNITLRNLTAEKLTVKSSTVKLENCRIGSIRAENATIQLTGCRITRTARMKKTILDSAGSVFSVKNHLLNGKGKNKLVFSLCIMQTQQGKQLLHSAVQPPAGYWP